MKRSSQIYLADNDSFRIAVELCRVSSPIVIDGGAHKGAATEAFRAFLLDGEFHCFEPDPFLVLELEKKFNGQKKIKINQAALGDYNGTVEFNINESRPTSSILNVTEIAEIENKSLYKTLRRINTPIMTIDSYCKNNDLTCVDIIKLDLQGYDYFALQGAIKTLEHAKVVLIEVLFFELYEGSRLFTDILLFLKEHNFRLFTLSGIHYGLSGELLWADGIFIKEDNYEISLSNNKLNILGQC